MTKEEKTNLISELSIVKTFGTLKEQRKAYLDEAKSDIEPIKKVSKFISSCVEKNAQEFIETGVLIFGICQKNYKYDAQQHESIELSQKEFISVSENIWILKAALSQYSLDIQNYYTFNDEKLEIPVAIFFKICERKYKNKRRKHNRKKYKRNQNQTIEQQEQKTAK